MFRIKRKERKQNPMQEKVAGKIAGAFIWLQTKFSDAMNRRVSGMNSKKLKLALAAFCFISGGLSIYFLVDAIVARPAPALRIDPVQIPKHYDQSGDEVMEGVMPGDIYNDIQEYRKYMDSIGEPIRPGLRDSMRIIEELYLQEQMPK